MVWIDTGFPCSLVRSSSDLQDEAGGHRRPCGRLPVRDDSRAWPHACDPHTPSVCRVSHLDGSSHAVGNWGDVDRGV